MNNRLSVRKALVVDSDSDRLDAITRVLACEYPVLSISRQEDALRVADAARPDIIVLSAIPPNAKKAIATFRELKDNPATHRTPIIILTVSQTRIPELESVKSADDLHDFVPTFVLEAPMNSVCLRSEVDRVIRGSSHSANEALA